MRGREGCAPVRAEVLRPAYRSVVGRVAGPEVILDGPDARTRGDVSRSAEGITGEALRDDHRGASEDCS